MTGKVTINNYLQNETYNRKQSQATADVGHEGDEIELAGRPCHSDDEFNAKSFIQRSILYIIFLVIPGISTIEVIDYVPFCYDQYPTS